MAVMLAARVDVSESKIFAVGRLYQVPNLLDNGDSSRNLLAIVQPFKHFIAMNIYPQICEFVNTGTAQNLTDGTALVLTNNASTTFRNDFTVDPATLISSNLYKTTGLSEGAIIEIIVKGNFTAGTFDTGTTGQTFAIRMSEGTTPVLQSEKPAAIALASEVETEFEVSFKTQVSDATNEAITLQGLSRVQGDAVTAAATVQLSSVSLVYYGR